MYVYAVEGVSKPLTRNHVLSALEQTAFEFELHKVLAEQKPSRSHWHFKRAAGSGTLEVTWDGTANTVQVLVHTNRVGADSWAKNLAPQFAETLAKKLGGHVISHVTHGH